MTAGAGRWRWVLAAGRRRRRRSVRVDMARSRTGRQGFTIDPPDLGTQRVGVMLRRIVAAMKRSQPAPRIDEELGLRQRVRRDTADDSVGLPGRRVSGDTGVGWRVQALAAGEEH